MGNHELRGAQARLPRRRARLERSRKVLAENSPPPVQTGNRQQRGSSLFTGHPSRTKAHKPFKSNNFRTNETNVGDFGCETVELVLTDAELAVYDGSSHSGTNQEILCICGATTNLLGISDLPRHSPQWHKQFDSVQLWTPRGGLDRHDGFPRACLAPNAAGPVI